MAIEQYHADFSSIYIAIKHRIIMTVNWVETKTHKQFALGASTMHFGIDLALFNQ